MEKKKDGTITYEDYRELWNYNLQKIEHVQLAIENSIRELEIKYSEFESFYDGILEQVDIMSSIYSGYNTIDGAESVLRLKALIQSYRARYTREGLDFNLMHRLLHAITEAREGSFDGFPGLTHRDAPAVTEGIDPHGEELSLRKCKWITFERNRSWFIARFISVDLARDPDYTLVGVEEPDFLRIDIDGRILRARDIFARSPAPAIPPPYIIQLDRGKRNYAANRIGKRIFADRDFLTPLVRPFKKTAPNALSPGRIRLFGKNHLLLY